MRQSVSYLTQSKYYSPAFNAAVFDGAVRVYFAQSQESEALKTFFRVQEKLGTTYETLKENLKISEINIFLMLYPNNETFDHSFQGNEAVSGVVLEKLGNDFVIGVRGPIGDLEFVRIQEGFFRILNSHLAPEPTSSFEL